MLSESSQEGNLFTTDTSYRITNIDLALSSPQELDSIATMLKSDPYNKLVCVILINDYSDNYLDDNDELTKLISYFMENDISDDRIEIKYDLSDDKHKGKTAIELSIVNEFEDQLKRSDALNAKSVESAE
jgi:hypothetical protein